MSAELQYDGTSLFDIRSYFLRWLENFKTQEFLSGANPRLKCLREMSVTAQWIPVSGVREAQVAIGFGSPAQSFTASQHQTNQEGERISETAACRINLRIRCAHADPDHVCMIADGLGWALMAWSSVFERDLGLRKFALEAVTELQNKGTQDAPLYMADIPCSLEGNRVTAIRQESLVIRAIDISVPHA